MSPFSLKLRSLVKMEGSLGRMVRSLVRMEERRESDAEEIVFVVRVAGLEK